MNQEQLDAIKERVDDTAEGPWYAAAGRIYNGQVQIPYTSEDAEFIAHAHKDVPALVAEVERLRKTLQTIAEHNIFTTPQIDIKDFARQALDGEAHD